MTGGEAQDSRSDGVWLGVDTGGTFTDFVLFDAASGRMDVVKVPSDPTAPNRVFEEGLTKLGTHLADADRIVHGTTLVTNLILEEDGAKVAMVTTAGYRDLLEIGRQNRFEMYNLKTQRVSPLSPRRMRFELGERILADGTVESHPTDAELEVLESRLKESGAEAVAVCCLFAYLDPINEQRVKTSLEAAADWYITASHEIVREAGEYERFSTTVMNAYVGPRVRRYLTDLEAYFVGEGAPSERTFLISSSGGAMTWETAKSLPVNLMNSGPAGGVKGAIEVAAELGLENIITYDMGGTSTDVSLIRNRHPVITSEGFLDRRPLMVPKLDISTIGAGGGSIAWIGLGGELNIGPRSAGAVPGPASYGQGGTEPTVTDADLLVGRLSPDQMLGGKFELDRTAAEVAVAKIAAAFPGMTLMGAAEGIIRVAVAKMTTAIREVSVARGIDPREFALFAYGGAGPMHATEIATELEMPTVVIPPVPSNFSAFGLLMSDVRHDLVRSRFIKTLEVSVDEYEAAFGELEEEGRQLLRREGFSDENMRIDRSVDMRYTGQWFELNVPAPELPDGMSEVDKIFRQAHLQRYSMDMERSSEIVNFRIAALGVVRKPTLVAAKRSSSPPGDVRTRTLIFSGQEVEVAVFDRASLPVGFEFEGPAVVEEYGSSTIVTPEFVGRVEDAGALMLSRR